MKKSTLLILLNSATAKMQKQNLLLSILFFFTFILLSGITANAQAAAPPAPTIFITQPSYPLSTGSITATAPSGTGYTYSINGGAFQPNPVFSGLASGSYTITTKNYAGLISNTTAFNINTLPAGPTCISSQTTLAASTGSITVTAPTGIGYSYSIDGLTYQSSPVFTGIPAGSYHLTVKSNAGIVSAATASNIDENSARAASALATCAL
jgi:hypothetical protein